jgi:hypothetical protein
MRPHFAASQSLCLLCYLLWLALLAGLLLRRKLTRPLAQRQGEKGDDERGHADRSWYVFHSAPFCCTWGSDGRARFGCKRSVCDAVRRDSVRGGARMHLHLLLITASSQPTLPRRGERPRCRRRRHSEITEYDDYGDERGAGGLKPRKKKRAYGRSGGRSFTPRRPFASPRPVKQGTRRV